MLLGCQVEICQPVEFRVFICRDINTFTILAELTVVVGDFFLRVAWCQRNFLSCRRVHQPEIGLIDRKCFQQEDVLVVRRPIKRLPSATFQFRQQVICFRVGGIHDPQIGIPSGAPRGHVRDLISF